MIKIFLDSSDISEIKEFIHKVDGVTTNPTLMRKAGIQDYEKFCKEVLEIVKDKPVSFEVFADDFNEMERQARIISSWGENVYVKIPITNILGKSTKNLVFNLSKDFIKLNITALTTLNQFCNTGSTFGTPSIISIFAGRIADTGENPVEIIKETKRKKLPHEEILWASSREVLNIYQAEEAGADIITVTPELFRKYEAMKGKDLNELSLDTVKQFFQDAQKAGYKL